MWYKIVGQQVEMYIYAKPNARRSEVTGVTEHGLGVALHARPQDGEANEELIAFLSKHFKAPKSKIILRRGETGRRKLVIMPLTSKLKDFLGNL